MWLSNRVLPSVLLAWQLGNHVVSAGSVDLVFLIDESGSMGDDQAEVKAQAKNIFQKLQDEVDNSILDSFRVGLVGFGRWWHDQPSRNLNLLQLTDDQADFEQKVDDLITSGGTEPGLEAIYQTTTNTIEHGGASIEPNYPEEDFPGNGGYCALVITDEVSNGDDNSQAEVQTELGKTGSVVFVVGPSFPNDYETLATSTGGGYFTIEAFRQDSQPIFDAIIDKCVSTIQQNAGCDIKGTPYEVTSSLPATIGVEAEAFCTVGDPMSTTWSSVDGKVAFTDASELSTDATANEYGTLGITFTTECEDPNDPVAPPILKVCETAVDIVNTPPHFNCGNSPCPACPDNGDELIAFDACQLSADELVEYIKSEEMFIDDEGHSITYTLEKAVFELGEAEVFVVVADEFGLSVECPLTVTLSDDTEIDDDEVDCGLYPLRDDNPDWHIQPCDTPLRYAGSAYGGTGGLKPNGCPVTSVVDPNSLLCERCNGAYKVIHPDCDGIYSNGNVVTIMHSSGVGNFISWTMQVSSAGQTLTKACGVCVERPNNDGCQDDNRNLRNQQRSLTARFECPETKPASGSLVWPFDSLEVVDVCEEIAPKPNDDKHKGGNKKD